MARKLKPDLQKTRVEGANGIIEVEHMAISNMVAEIFIKMLLNGTFSKHAITIETPVRGAFE